MSLPVFCGAACLVMEKDVMDLIVDSSTDSDNVECLLKVPPISRIQLLKILPDYLALWFLCLRTIVITYACMYSSRSHVAMSKDAC